RGVDGRISAWYWQLEGRLVEAYSRPSGMRVGFQYFGNFDRDARHFVQLSTTPIRVPVLVLSGEKASGNFLVVQARLVASDIQTKLSRLGTLADRRGAPNCDSCDYRFH